MATNANDFNYRAYDRANARMMDTNIWQACKILGIDGNACRTGEVFRKLFNLYLAEELAKAE